MTRVWRSDLLAAAGRHILDTTHALSLEREETHTLTQSPVRSPAPYTYTPENGAAKIVVRQHDDDVHEHPPASICMA